MRIWKITFFSSPFFLFISFFWNVLISDLKEFTLFFSSLVFYYCLLFGGSIADAVFVPLVSHTQNADGPA